MITGEPIGPECFILGEAGKLVVEDDGAKRAGMVDVNADWPGEVDLLALGFEQLQDFVHLPGANIEGAAVEEGHG